MEEKARHELLKSVYEQHWLHARHVENERLWFTNIFGLIVAGLLSFLVVGNKWQIPSPSAIPAGCFILILSMLGYFLCLSWRAPFVQHTILVNKMHEDALLKKYAPYAPGYERLKFWGISAHELFLYFYALMAGMALLLVLYVGLAWCYWWVSIILLVILCALWRGFFMRQEKKYVEKTGLGYGRYAKKRGGSS